jgi:SWI/SNF-related matrix-associated actin-dependent regulator 1 of chromatin subfamily A
LTPTAFGAGVPSGFAPASGASAPPVRHPNPQVRAAYGMDVDSAESRKRGRPQDLPARVPATPESPDVQRPGQRRRLAPSDSPVSDDPFADAGANGAPQRLVRARPDADFENDQRFRRFKVTQPLHGADRVKAAWDEARGNVPGATALLEDPTWSPRTSKAVALPAPTSAPTIKPETGRVKEVDEANQAARQVQREKAKKSAIYQNRIVLEKSKVVPSTVVAASPVKRASPPPSPVIALPRRPRKVAKRVVDSDSGDDFAESDDDRRPSKPESMEDRNEEQALKYFNTAGPEALQELSGPSRSSTCT